MSKSVNLERNPVSGRNQKLSDKLVEFILGILIWNKSFKWNELSNKLLNIFSKYIKSRAIKSLSLAKLYGLIQSFNQSFDQSLMKA